MNTSAPTLLPIEDAETTAWLSATLRPDRERTAEGPTAAAIDRIRARIFNQAAARKRDQIAA